jgi:hypothetical protein
MKSARIGGHLWLPANLAAAIVYAVPEFILGNIE